MAPSPTNLARQVYSTTEQSDNQFRTNIIIIIIVVLVVKILILVALISYSKKKRRERAARGCKCYSNVDYWCLPWWYTLSDRHCKCPPQSTVPLYNVPTEYAPAPPPYMPEDHRDDSNGRLLKPIGPEGGARGIPTTDVTDLGVAERTSHGR